MLFRSIKSRLKRDLIVVDGIIIILRTIWTGRRSLDIGPKYFLFFTCNLLAIGYNVHMNSINIRKQNFIDCLALTYGLRTVFSREECLTALHLCQQTHRESYSVLPAWLVNDPVRRVSRGSYLIVEVQDSPHYNKELQKEILENLPSSDLTPPETSVTITPMNSNTNNFKIGRAHV
mgnify:FL=1